MKMRYCKNCLQPDTRPGIKFDENGICYACKYEFSKKTIDWVQRETELRKIAEEAKQTAKERNLSYDCVIGVSGGKDSTFQAVYAKEKLGLRPLLINSMPDDITEIGRHNLNVLSNMGFDIITIRPNPNVAKKLARICFYKYGNIIKASEYALWYSAYMMADKFDIPLVIQGENAALTLGTAAIQEETGDAFSVIQLDTLKHSISDICEGVTGISENDLALYQVSNLKKIKEKGIKAIFLQYYTKEWSQVYNADFSVARGLKGRDDDLHDIGRYRRYSSLDCDLAIPNQMIKYLKFGFGFATDEVCYDIREGRLSREDGIWYVKEYDGLCGDKYVDLACKYLSITKEEFWKVVDQYVNRDLFYKDENGKWVPKFEIGKDYEC